MPLNYNGRDLLEKCLPGMLDEADSCPLPAELWVVDNNSSDDSRELVRSSFPKARWVGFRENRVLAAYNDALRNCQAPYVMLLNNDMLLKRGCLASLLRRLESDSGYFAVSPAIEAEDPADLFLRRRLGRFFHGHLGCVEAEPGPGGCLYFFGGAALVRRELFLELGGFDPIFFYMEDNDLSYRAWRRGHPCVFEPSARAFHIGSATTKRVHGAGRKRGLKEKAANLFVIKNVQEPSWLLNFAFWSIMKTAKMAFCMDGTRAWAWKETLRRLPGAMAGRAAQPRLKDRMIMERIRALRLAELPPVT